MDAKKAARAAAAAAAAEGAAAEQAGQPRPQQQQPAQQQYQEEEEGDDAGVEAAAKEEPEWSEPPPEEAERGEASTGGPPVAAGGEVAGGGVACGPSVRPAVGFTPAQLLVLRNQVVAFKTLQSLLGVWLSPEVLSGIQVPPLVLPVPAGAPDTAPAAAPGPAAAAEALSTRAGGSAAPAPVAAASSRAAARHTAGQWPASSLAEHPVEWWQKEGPEAMAVEDHPGPGPAGSSPPLSEGEEEHAGPWQPAAAPPAHKLPSPLSMLRHGSGGAGVPAGPVQGLSQPSPRDTAPGPACPPFQQQQQRGDAPHSASGGLAAPCAPQQQWKQQQHQAPWARAPLREPNGGAGWQGDQAAGCAAPPAARGGSGSMNPMIDVLAEFGGVVPDSDSDW